MPRPRGSCTTDAPLLPGAEGEVEVASVRKREECSYLCKQRHGSSPCLYSFYIYSSTGNRLLGRTVAHTGWVSSSGRALSPWPRHSAIYCSGWTQTTKNGSSKRGARANCPAETCLQDCNYNWPLHPRSYFGAVMDTPVPPAHPPMAHAPCLPASWGRGSLALLAGPRLQEKLKQPVPPCPRGPRGLHFHLSHTPESPG